MIYGESATLKTPNGTSASGKVVIHDPGDLANPDRFHISESARVVSVHESVIGRPPRETEIVTANQRFVVDEIEKESIGVYNLVCRDAS